MVKKTLTFPHSKAWKWCIKSESEFQRSIVKSAALNGITNFGKVWSDIKMSNPSFV